MTVKPTDIVNWEAIQEKLEPQIDEELKKKWKGSGSVTINLPERLPTQYALELVRLYQKAGWTVRHEKGDSQKDGPWNFLQFSVKSGADDGR